MTRPPNRVRTLLPLALLLACVACPGGKAAPGLEVLVAARALEAGAVLEPEMLARLELPEAALRPGMIRASGLGGVLGQQLAVALAAGDPLPQSALVPARLPLDLGARIHTRGRAMTLPVSGADEARRGDRVDVLASLVDPSSGETVTLTAFENLTLLALGPAPTAAPRAGAGLPLRLATFEVLAEEAEILALALGSGAVGFHVTLRHPDDPDLSEERGRTTMTTLLTGGRPRALQTLRYRTIQIIRGSDSRGPTTGSGAGVRGNTMSIGGVGTKGRGGGLAPGRSGDSAGPGGLGFAPDPAAKAATAQKAGRADEGDAPAIAPQPLLQPALGGPKPGKVVFRDERGGFQALPVRALRVMVHVEGPRARTVVDYVIENPYPRVLEGTLRYPLPQDATPAFFATFQGAPPLDPADLARAADRVLPALADDAGASARLTSLVPGAAEGEELESWKEFRPARVVPREQAAQVYEKIVRKKVDPALLEWAGGNDFEARVYPIAPRSLKRVVLVYEQTLPFEDGLAHWSFPLPERPVPEAEARIYVDEEKAGITGLSLAGADARAALGEKQGSFRAATVDLSGRAFEGALSLAMRPREPRAHFVVGGRDPALPGRFVFGRLFPEIPGGGQAAPTGEALFVVDTSLSEDGDRARLAGQMLEAVLGSDETITRFNVMLFDVRAKWLYPAGSRENTPAARAEALRRLAAVQREGATNFGGALALLERTEWLPEDATVFLLSDGQITWGESSPRRLLAAAPRAGALRWIGYRFGESATNRALLEVLTRRNGRVVSCLSADQVARSALAHRRAMLAVESIRVEGAELHDFVVRGNPQALFPGQEIQLAGRALGEEVEAAVVIHGSLDGQPVALRQPFRLEGRDMLAPRAWAELHVERLLAFGSSKVDRLAIALSQHFGLTNRLASLLVLESDADYPRYEIAREQVSVAEVEAEAKGALARAEEHEPGLDPVTLGTLARDLIAALPDGPDDGGLGALALRPYAGGRRRALAEALSRQARRRKPDDALALFELNHLRRSAGDALGAVRAISSIVELRPQDPEALRLTGFVLLAQGFALPAAEVLGRLRAIRSFEVQAFIEEATALEEAGRLSGAVRNYELVLTRRWERHREVVEAARQHYLQLLTRLEANAELPEKTRRQLGERRAQLVPGLQAELQVTMHWNVDDIDIDLWVTGPEGEKCYYRNPQTPSGGRLFWDTTTGYGPEIFQQHRVQEGAYLAQVHYYANNSEQWAIPAVALGILDDHPWDPARHRRQFAVELLADQRRSVRDLFRFDAQASKPGVQAWRGLE